MVWLSLRMLFGDTTKWLGVVLGIFLSTFLITHMLGMFNGMMARTYALITDIPLADVWVMDPTVEYVDDPAGMPDTALDRVRGVDGVHWATPLLTGAFRAKLPGGTSRTALLVGVDDATFIGGPDTVVGGRIEDLRRLDAVIVDSISASTLMRTPINPRAHPTPDASSPGDEPTRPMRIGDEFYINDRRVIVVAFAELGPRFLARPVVYMPYSRALSVLPKQRNMLSFVLVRARAGVDPGELARRINTATGLRARSSAEFARDTYWYYVETTGVVARIGFMVGVAIVVGVSVSALLLYLFTAENARAYALLTAMGATRWVISLMVVIQSLVAGGVGYGLGVGASSLLGMVTPASSMPYRGVWWSLATSGSVVVLICTAASLLSLRKVFSFEPAMVFQR